MYCLPCTAYRVLPTVAARVSVSRQVLKARTEDNQVFAIKVIRNRHAFRKQAEVEVELLRRLKVRHVGGDT